MIHYSRKPNPRAEYRLRRTEQIEKSAILCEKFPKLKALRVTVDYFDAKGTARQGSMKYKLNLDGARSLFCLNCVNPDCVGGDYDLSEPLSRAVAAKSTVAEGELRCQGTRHNKDRKEVSPCQSLLRYKFSLAY